MEEKERIAHCAGQVESSKNRITILREQLQIEEEKTLPHWLKELYLAENGGEELRN